MSAWSSRTLGTSGWWSAPAWPTGGSGPIHGTTIRGLLHQCVPKLFPHRRIRQAPTPLSLVPLPPEIRQDDYVAIACRTSTPPKIGSLATSHRASERAPHEGGNRTNALDSRMFLRQKKVRGMRHQRTTCIPRDSKSDRIRRPDERS